MICLWAGFGGIGTPSASSLHGILGAEDRHMESPAQVDEVSHLHTLELRCLTQGQNRGTVQVKGMQLQRPFVDV